MNTTIQTYKPNFGKWEAHFKSMSKAKGGRKKIMTVKNINQSGSGVEMVSPARQVIDMAIGQKKQINRKKKSSKPHSTSRPRRGNISKKKKSTRKTVKRRRTK